MEKRRHQRFEKLAYRAYYVRFVLFPCSAFLLDIPSGFQIYACFRSSAECKNVCDGTGIYAFHIRFLYLELDKSKLQYRQRGLEGVESSAGRRTCKQHRTCVHSSYKLCVLLHDRLAVLRQLGQRQQRSLAVREYGIRTRGNDVYTSHFQQINL